MKKTILTLFTGLLVFSAYAQIRSTTIAKPISQNLLVNVKQRNIEAEQQAFGKRSNSEEAWFYENANYGGRKFVLERGSYTLKELGTDLNDFLSSAVVPSNLIVVVYTNDNFDGDWYILTPENNNNLNFEKTVVAKANVGNRLISGKADINDIISSIIIYNPDQDYIDFNSFGESNNIYTNLNQFDKDKCYRAFPGPGLSGVDGHNMADIGPLNDKITYIRLNNYQMSVQIHQDAGFKGYQGLLKKEVRDYPLFAKPTDLQVLGYISMTDCGTITSSIGMDRAWKNRVSSFKVNIGPGRLTEIYK
ncbi:peptidase inhibitor family I36 protein [Mucilaginibacter psychrotolerans]|uniref:Beta/gamma crystallin 'Greek key' domain-containing protein n=1 Tax=Mucilaginibacter psychrotolerans TaxID=1524096 RepID=A0A4Y8S941_9SPHI|nr:peptidase inhibitor family I36 protein [Mucilaginibacter psychrotolerans]TFF35549.1 hypothetical protein E2R66_18875 [Mucilaginibacter psychrotolerans]